MNEKAQTIKKVALLGLSFASGSIISALIASHVPAAEGIARKVFRWAGVFALGIAAGRIIDRELSGYADELIDAFTE